MEEEYKKGRNGEVVARHRKYKGKKRKGIREEMGTSSDTQWDRQIMGMGFLEKKLVSSKEYEIF